MNHIDIITDVDNKKIVVINDLRFKGRRNVNWDEIEQCLKEYIGNYIEIMDTSDIVYIGPDFPDEFVHSNDTINLRGSAEYAKANSSIAIKEIVEISSNKKVSINYKKKHKYGAKFGWYSFDSKFAIPIYNDYDELIRYNIFKAKILVRHDQNGKMYLYDILGIKKEKCMTRLG